MSETTSPRRAKTPRQYAALLLALGMAAGNTAQESGADSRPVFGCAQIPAAPGDLMLLL